MELELNARVAVGESSKVFELSLSKDYVSHWGMVQAVRELIQNALDSDSPFEYEFEETEEGERCLRLISRFTTLPPSTLLLGTTSKAGADDKIGSFGEGYKIAMLVLTRLGHEVQFKNGDRLWRPKFRYSKKYETEVLVIEAFPLQHNRGLTVEVHGLSEDDERDIRASCLKMQPVDRRGDQHALWRHPAGQAGRALRRRTLHLRRGHEVRLQHSACAHNPGARPADGEQLGLAGHDAAVLAGHRAHQPDCRDDRGRGA
jgi:hypothetical protein